jgi:Ion transport protein
MVNEVVQLSRAGFKDYYSSVWNFLDVILPVLIVVVISYHLAELRDAEYMRPAFIETVHSVSSLLSWIKFLYFLRIFKHTAYLINMINTVIYDMRIFLLILTIIYLGFGEAFLRLSERSSEESAWLADYGHALIYSFRLSIGDTDTETYDDSVQKGTVWVLFVLCILYTNVVMLNLLIAIISESFGKINSNASFANYQERARLIAENSYLIPNYVKKEYSPVGLYLIKAQEVIEEELIEEEE